MDGEISSLNERTILAQHGPMTLTIQAWDRNGPDIGLAARAGEFAFGVLPRIASARELFRGWGRGHRKPDSYPARPFAEPVLEAMCRAAENVRQDGLGPMAAVAGAVADEVLGWLVRAGAVKAIVENGGDLSIYLGPEQATTVGVRTSLEHPGPSYALKLDGARTSYWGVATSSGLGGRGLNRGLAEAAVCMAAGESPCGAAADAAATATSNACVVESPAVKLLPAEQLDPDTDIPGLLVTARVGELSAAEIEAALDSAASFAQGLVSRNVILGSCVFLKDGQRQTSDFAAKIGPLIAL